MRPAREFQKPGCEIMQWFCMNPSRLTRGEARVRSSVMHWVITLQHAGGWDMMRQATFPLPSKRHGSCDLKDGGMQSRSREWDTNPLNCSARHTVAFQLSGTRLKSRPASLTRRTKRVNPMKTYLQSGSEHLPWIWSERVQLWCKRHSGANDTVSVLLTTAVKNLKMDVAAVKKETGVAAPQPQNYIFPSFAMLL